MNAYRNEFKMLKSKVRGLPDRFNDLILSDRSSSVSKLIVFFGGDVQDLEDVMRSHRDNHRYIKWSLEAVTKLLQESIPSSQVESSTYTKLTSLHAIC